MQLFFLTILIQHFISHLEQKDQTIQFKRIDADVTEELKGEGAADGKYCKNSDRIIP